MTTGLSTHLTVSRRLTPAWLDRAARAGIAKIEVFCARQSFDYRDRTQVASLGEYFRDSGAALHSLHSPIYNDEEWGRSGPRATVNIADTERIRRKDSVDEVKRALEVAERAPFRYLIQHLGVAGEEFHESKFDAAFSSLEELNLFARHREVEILLENIPNGLSTSGRLMQFVEATHLDNGFCFDSGHAHIMEGVDRAFESMKDRVRSTHLHDNDGSADSHLYPGGEGTIDWKRTLELLRSRPAQYPLLLELREPEDSDDPLAAAMGVFENWEVS
ncbi:MAG: sugar phosphate isomerase/epimerase family protein [Bryobacteraceae bacterium]